MCGVQAVLCGRWRGCDGDRMPVRLAPGVMSFSGLPQAFHLSLMPVIVGRAVAGARR